MNEYELDGLDDDALIARLVAARSAAHWDMVELTVCVLVNRRLPDVIRRVSIAVPASDVEDVAMEAVVSAIKAGAAGGFAGTSVGEFVNFLHRIVARRIADFHRSRREATAPLPDEHEGDDEIWLEVAGSGDPAERLPDAIDARAAIRTAYGELSPPHRAVVDRFVFGGMDAGATAEDVNMIHGKELDPPMSAQNVHTIGSRFRKRVRELLEEADDT